MLNIDVVLPLLCSDLSLSCSHSSLFGINVYSMPLYIESALLNLFSRGSKLRGCLEP